jgi:phosphonate transport system ATP-binding protein
MTDLRRTAKESGIPTLVNIHDVSLARAFADRIIGIADGVVVFDGPPERLDEDALIRVYKGSAAAFGGIAGRTEAAAMAEEPGIATVSGD